MNFANATIYPSFVGLPTSIIISLLFLSFDSKSENYSEENPSLMLHLTYSIIGGLLGITAICCLSKSLEYEEASRVSIFRMTDVIFAFLFQYLLLNISSDYIDVIGIFLIMCGTLMIVTHKPLTTAFETLKNGYITLK